MASLMTPDTQRQSKMFMTHIGGFIKIIGYISNGSKMALKIWGTSMEPLWDLEWAQQLALQAGYLDHSYHPQKYLFS